MGDSERKNKKKKKAGDFDCKVEVKHEPSTEVREGDTAEKWEPKGKQNRPKKEKLVTAWVLENYQQVEGYCGCKIKKSDLYEKYLDDTWNYSCSYHGFIKIVRRAFEKTKQFNLVRHISRRQIFTNLREKFNEKELKI